MKPGPKLGRAGEVKEKSLHAVEIHNCKTELTIKHLYINITYFTNVIRSTFVKIYAINPESNENIIKLNKTNGLCYLSL